MTKIIKLKKNEEGQLLNRSPNISSKKRHKLKIIKRRNKFIHKKDKINRKINKESNINEILNSLKYIKTNDFIIEGKIESNNSDLIPKIKNGKNNLCFNKYNNNFTIQKQNEMQIHNNNIAEKNYNSFERSKLFSHPGNIIYDITFIPNDNLPFAFCPFNMFERNFGNFNINNGINNINQIQNINNRNYVDICPSIDSQKKRNVNYNERNNNLNSNINDNINIRKDNVNGNNAHNNNINIRNDNNNVNNANNTSNNIINIKNDNDKANNASNNNINSFFNDIINNDINNNFNDNSNSNDILYFNNNFSDNNNNIDSFPLIQNDYGDFPNNRSIKSLKERLLRIKLSKLSNLEDDKKNCMICLEEFKKGQNIYFLPCLHVFHVRCFNKEIKIRQKCPICRENL